MTVRGDAMRIKIEKDGLLIFEMDEANALAPLEKSERAVVFQALTDALALISGFMLTTASCAKEAPTSEHSPASGQYHEGRESSNIVRLTTRRGSPEQPATLR